MGKMAKSKAAANDEGSAGGKRATRTPPPDLKVVAGKNSTLSDDEERALFFQHRRFYETALAVKKKADADLRNVAKKAKADLGEHAVHQIKTAIELESDDGSETIKARMERELQVARWLGLPIGAQGSLFEEDRRPAEEKAEQEGFVAGAGGEWMKVPERYGASSPAGQAWIRGWHRGQDSIFNISEKRGDPLLRPGGADLSVVDKDAGDAES